MSQAAFVDAPPALDVERLVRPHVRAIPGYTREEAPAEAPPRVVRLDWNESPHGPSPNTRAALAAFDGMHRYPDLDAAALRAALGRYVGAPAAQVVPGAGLDDVFSTMALALIEPGDRVVISEPTFGVYRSLFAVHGAEVVDVPLLPGFALDAEGVLGAVEGRTKLVIVCNPNNPTGNLLDAEAVEQVVAGASCLVAIDEAYAEFAGVAHLPLMARYPNVAVLRTMSKFAGLAGMRVGYGVFPSALMPHLERVAPAFRNLSAASTAAALASLDDLPYLEGVVARIVADRERLAARLRQLPLVEPLPSATNFLLVRLPVVDAAPVVAELGRRGVFVRHFPRPSLGIADCLRVSIGTTEENDIFLEELRDVLASGAGA